MKKGILGLLLTVLLLFGSFESRSFESLLGGLGNLGNGVSKITNPFFNSILPSVDDDYYGVRYYDYNSTLFRFNSKYFSSGIKKDDYNLYGDKVFRLRNGGTNGYMYYMIKPAKWYDFFVDYSLQEIKIMPESYSIKSPELYFQEQYNLIKKGKVIDFDR